MGKDVISVIKSRTSTRDYLQDEISDDILQDILSAGHEAPSAGNLRPWKFYVVKNKEKIKKLSEAAYEQQWMKEAPLVIVVCGLFDVSAGEYGKRGANLYAIQDTAAAVENMLLAAENYDLGSCWVGAFAEQEVKDILKMEENSWPVAMVTLGYSESKGEEEADKESLAEVVTYIE